MIIELSPGAVDNFGTILDLEEISETKVIQETKSKVQKKIRKLTKQGFGSSFMYYNNNLWNEVNKSKDYREVKIAVNQAFNKYLDECNNLIQSSQGFVFFGVGSQREVIEVMRAKESGANYELVDINPISLLRAMMASQVVSSEDDNVIGYIGDFNTLVFSENVNQPTTVILKGGTSGNLSDNELFELVDNHALIYIDFFERTDSDMHTISHYDNETGRVLALHNYMKLFHTGGYMQDRNFTDVLMDHLPCVNYSLATGETDEILCHIDPPYELKSYYLNEHGIEIPEKFKVFHSVRRNKEEFISSLSNHGEIEYVTSVSGCIGVLIRN